MQVSGSWVATGLLGLALVVGSSAPAAASWRQPVLSVSADGEHWSPSLLTPLFDGDRRWVPGDTRTVTVWVQDLSGGPSELELSLVGPSARSPDTDPWTRRARDVVVSSRVGGRPLVLDGERPARLVIDEPTAVDVSVTMPPRTTDGQREQTALVLLARLTDDPAAQSPAPGPDRQDVDLQDGSPRSLPFGLPLTVLALLVAARAAVRAGRDLHRRLRPTIEPIA